MKTGDSCHDLTIPTPSPTDERKYSATLNLPVEKQGGILT